jgi:hypothetical protein
MPDWPTGNVHHQSCWMCGMTWGALAGIKHAIGEAEMAVQTTSNQPVQIRERPKPAKPSKKGHKR